MAINNQTYLDNLEAKIRIELGRYDLDEMLVSVQCYTGKKLDFVLAGVSLFSIRYAHPPIRRHNKLLGIPIGRFEYVCKLVTQYLLADPYGFDPTAINEYRGSNLIPLLLRLTGNQFNFNMDYWWQYARTLHLYSETSDQLRFSGDSQNFDVDLSFEKINKVSIRDFIRVGFLAKDLTKLTGGYFQKVRTKGLQLPDDEVVKLVLDQLAADQFKMRDVYEKYKQQDRLYRAYDFNPLFVFPFVRPWWKNENTPLDDDKMIAPVPSLVLYRLSEGIYYQLFDKYKGTFAQYFGSLFEMYVGEVLSNSVRPNELISEKDIRKTYSDSRGKVPDWIVVDDNTATLIECKATGFNRKALATGDKEAIEHGVSSIVRGLVQLHEFKDACKKGVEGLERLSNITKFRLRIVTYEQFYNINSTDFRKKLDPMVTEDIKDKLIDIEDWHVLSLEDIERVEPHVERATAFNDVIEMLGIKNTTHEVFNKLTSETGKTFKDSFLMQKYKEQYDELVPFYLR